MKKNFKLVIAYDGTKLKGWQFQPNERTVQGDIENELSKLFKDQKINLIGSGRTDSGVHALRQIANIVLDTKWETRNIRNALNANLENDIYIKDVIEIDEKFHARFSAKKRSYKYFITNEYCPINRLSNWNTKKNINFEKLTKCASLVLVNKDFTNFCKATAEVKTKECKIYESKWINDEKTFIYTIKANRFLHHMVRFLVGTMIEVSRNRISINDFKNMLQVEKLNYSVFCAPAKGLFLDRVEY